MTVGFLFATKPFIQLIVNPFSGHLIDHVGYNVPMTIGMLLLSIATIMFAYLDSSFIALFLARGLQGAASAVTVTSGFAMIADVYQEQMSRTRALGIVVMALAVGSFLSVPFSGFLVEYVGKRMPFILLAVLALADCFLHVSYYYRKKTKKSKISTENSSNFDRKNVNVN
jgi:MFS transporter, DHA1 family, solute carrier family 18 (vesicular acetylcholine transporter), member 3